MNEIINNFVVLFVVVDPIGLAAIFFALTADADARFRRRMAVHGVALAAVILLVFYFFGDALMRTLGVGIPAFRIAGGLLLFLLAIDMVFARQSGLRSTTVREQIEAEAREDISVFPLAFPLISGPGAITSVLLMAGHDNGAVLPGAVVGVMLLVLALTLVSLLLAERLMSVLGQTGANVVSRVLGLVLAALAVQFVIDGLQGAFPAWSGAPG